MAEPGSRKRRLQSGAACENCRKRKSRCDAVRPQCSNCHLRSISCDYVTAEDSVQENEAQTLTESYSGNPQPANWPLNSSVIHGPERTSPADIEINSLTDRQRSSSILAAHECHAPQTYFGDSSTFAFGSDGSPNGPKGVQGSNRRSRDSITLHDSTSSHDSSCIAGSLESCFELPDRAFADSLVDAYFNRIHRLYPFLHEGDFRTAYETMWEQSSPIRYHSRLSWFGVLNMVFAYGCEFCGTIQDQEILAVAAPFVARSRSIVLSHIFKSSTLETVQSLLLMCYYLQGTVELDECWNLVGLMIRTAISLGLHLSPETEKFLPIERELRKRAWWGCFVIDRTLSMKFGRPLTLSVEEGNVDLPLEVDDQYIINGSRTPRQPVGAPSFTAFFVATIRLSHIVYNMLTELYLRGHKTYDVPNDANLQPTSPKYNHILSKVILLDGQLQSWWESAPQHLTQEPKENERSWMDFQSQRTVLRIRYLHVRLLLHRKIFLDLSRNQINNDFCQSIAISSARICIDSARQTIVLIKNCHPRQQLNSLWYNAQYVFSSMCVLYILDRLDKDKRSLLGEDTVNGSGEGYHGMGMELLRTASRSSLLAARYIAILQQLQSEHGDGKSTSGSKNSSVSAHHQTVSQTHNSQVPADPQDSITRWALNPHDPVPGTDLDFVDIDDLFYSTGPPGDFLMGPAGNQLPAAYMNW